MGLRVYLIAGEPSGDRLAAALMKGLRELVPAVEFRGVAGPLMQAEGLESQFPMSELSVMGLAEILPKYRALKARIRETAADAVSWAPDVMITVDSPDFSLRVAKQVKAQSAIRTVHYVAPSVWAWRKGRAAKMAKMIDQVLALLPFEPPYMEAEGIRCDFVGHPVVTEPEVTAQHIEAFRARHAITGEERPLVLLPGSRISEVCRLMAGFQEALAKADLTGAQVILPTLPHLTDTVRGQLSDAFQSVKVIDGTGLSAEEAGFERRVAMAQAQVALAASGTVSLELSSVNTPMVIAYDVAWLSRIIMQRMLLVDTVTLVNLVSETRAVPEFIGSQFDPAAIAKALSETLKNPRPQQAAMALTMDRLGRGGEWPGRRAAQAVMDGLDSARA